MLFRNISALLMVACCIATGVTFIAGIPWVPIEFFFGAILMFFCILFCHSERL